MEDKLLFILNYLKTNPLQESHAQHFGMQQSQANHYIHLLLPLVKQSLADCGELPARMMEDLNLEEEAVGLYFHDGTERPITRPQDPEEQKFYYSGKQKDHTIKNDVLINERGKIRFLTDTVESKKNDKRLADESGYRVPEGSVLARMLAFKAFNLREWRFCNRKRNPAVVSCPTPTRYEIA